MSLINQALKLEQQKRHAPSGPQPPMMHRMARQNNSSKLPLLLVGLTGMGMLLAVSITAIFYFGSDFLNSGKGLASAATPQTDEQTNAQTAASSPQSESQPEQFSTLLDQLSPEQLSTVQQMLLEREQSETTAIAAPSEPADSSSPTDLLPPQIDLSEKSRLQDLVDAYSVQGIRKAGQDTKVFLNGKIRRIGDVVDIENKIVLVGFTETALVFRANGNAYEKSL